MHLHVSFITFAYEFVSRAVDLELDSPPSFRVLAPAQVGHRLLTPFVHVHITGWNKKKKIRVTL